MILKNKLTKPFKCVKIMQMIPCEGVAGAKALQVNNHRLV